MQLHFLGTASGYVSKNRQHFSLYLSEADQDLLIDCGSAFVSQHFANKSDDCLAPQAIFLTHAHSDHLMNFTMLIQGLWLKKRQAPLTVYGPKQLLDQVKIILPRRLLFPKLLSFRIKWVPVRDGKTYRFGKWKIKPFATTHLAALQKRFGSEYQDVCFECFGVTVETPRKRICVSSDLGSPKDLERPLKNTPEILVSELAHFGSKQLFEMLRDYPLRELLLVHYGDWLTNKEAALKKEAKQTGCAFPIRLAKDGLQRRY